jgi:hypothetical protein
LPGTDPRAIRCGIGGNLCVDQSLGEPQSTTVANGTETITPTFGADGRTLLPDPSQGNIKFKADESAIAKILELKPLGIVMEPTGIWYSNFWKHLATFHKIPIYWIGHGDLAAQRKSYGFRNKRDDEDAFALALTYFDDRFVNVYGKP